MLNVWANQHWKLKASLYPLRMQMDGDWDFPVDWHKESPDVARTCNSKISDERRSSSSGFGNHPHGSTVPEESSHSLQKFVHPGPKQLPSPNPGLDISILQNQVILGERCCSNDTATAVHIGAAMVAMGSESLELFAFPIADWTVQCVKSLCCNVAVSVC